MIPEREGFKLTPWAEDAYMDFDARFDGGNCSCHISPPCGSCLHEGNPANLENTDDAWEKCVDLHLRLKSCYFNDIRAGVKPFEYRLMTDYWSKRIVDREYDRVIFHDAYKKASPETMIIQPYRGYEIQTITHDHFGPDPVTVFAVLAMKGGAT